MNPQVQQAIDHINQFIIENHNNEITADVLNPILVEIANLWGELVGDLSDSSVDGDTIIEMINQLQQNIEDVTGLKVHTGQPNPNVTPPATYSAPDLYVRLNPSNIPYEVYIYNGIRWVLIDSGITKTSEQWASYVLTGVGGLPILPQINENNRNINITGNPSGLSSLGGFVASGGASIANFWDGMTAKVLNSSPNNQTIKHNYSLADIKYLFPNEEDYIIRPNEVVYFDLKGGNLVFRYSTFLNAKNVFFDDTQSGLEAENVQDAIDEVYEVAIVKDYINVLDFGAVGDGVTESAQFIQNALDYAESNGIRRVYVPAGNYLLEKTIYIPTEIEFYGDGMDKTVFKIDAETVLDIIEMFSGSTHYQNFYSPVISTKTTRTGATLNNILLKDFKIDDIYYDDTGLVSQVCPMLILNTKNSTIENVEFGNVQTEEEQDGTTKTSLGLSTAFAENILINKCVHGFAGYEGVSIRLLSKNITTYKNVFNIDKPLTLANMTHALQVARPTSLVTKLQSEYGEVKSKYYTSDGDVFNLISNVTGVITAHSSIGIDIQNSIVNYTPNGNSFSVFRHFDVSEQVIIKNNIINVMDAGIQTGSLYTNGIISIGTTLLNSPNRENSKIVVSGNILNLELNRDVSSLPERDISALIGNLRDVYSNATITDNVVNITGTGVRDQAIFGAYGYNIVMSGNVVNFNGTVSNNMRAFVVEGGDRINVTNNTTIGEHAYSLKVNNAEVLSNFINGVNNFSGEVLNNQKTKTKTVAYIEDGLPISVFNQVSESSVNGNDGVNLFDPDYGFPMLFTNDLKDGNSFSGEFVIHIDNQNKPTSKVIELFGAEIYNNTNTSDEVIAKVSYKVDFFNPDGDNIDYKLSWQYVATGEILFGDKTDTIDSTDNYLFELIVTGHSDDIFTLKYAYLNRVFSHEERLLSTKTFKLGSEVKNAVYSNLILGNNIPKLNTILAIDEFISSLKTAGVWSKLDIFSLFQMNDNTLADFALYDYKRDTFMTAYGGIGYTINGYEGNGIDGYINTNFNPATNGVNYTLNNASRGAWTTKLGTSETGFVYTVIDVSSNTPLNGSINRMVISNNTAQRINQGSISLNQTADLRGLGLKVINRDDDTNVRLYNNLTEINRTATSTSVNNATQLLLTSASGYGDSGLGFYFMGASLTSQNVSDLRTAYLTYLTKIGL